MELILPLLVVLAGLMFLATRRQKREAKAAQDMQAGLALGDLVMTTSGLHGTITDLDDETVDLEIAPGVVTTWNRLAIRQLVTEDTAAGDTAAGDTAAGDTATPDRAAEIERESAAPRLSKD